MTADLRRPEPWQRDCGARTASIHALLDDIVDPKTTLRSLRKAQRELAQLVRDVQSVAKESRCR